MPRNARVSWLNVPHLVIAEANGGNQLFYDDSDYQYYLGHLRQMARDQLLKVFAFALLEKELRLVVQPKRLMLSRIMQRLHGKHTAHINQKLDRAGHLFRGRFRSIMFGPEDLLSVVRSVHLWPVREGLLRRPEYYPYCSHASYLGSATVHADFISSTEVLNQFSGEIELKRRAFGRYVELTALDPDDFGLEEQKPGLATSAVKIITHGPKLLHSKKSSLKILAERVSLLLSISASKLLSASKRQDLVMARRLLATASVIGAARSITEVAEFLGRDKAQISRLVSQGMDLMESDEAFAFMLESLKAKGAIKNELEL